MFTDFSTTYICYSAFLFCRLINTDGRQKFTIHLIVNVDTQAVHAYHIPILNKWHHYFDNGDICVVEFYKYSLHVAKTVARS